MSSANGAQQRIRHITSAQNSSVKKLRALLQTSEKNAVEIAFEGEHLLDESLRSSLKLETVFLSKSRATGENLGAYDSPGLDIISLPDALFRTVVATDAPQGVAAIAVRPVFQLQQILSVPNPLLLIAASIQDPGNLGTLIRSAEAFGAAGLLALPGTVSPWNQKALRASAGSVFRLPIVEVTIGDLKTLQQGGVRIYAAVAGDALQASDAPLHQASAIMIGNEGAGLSASLLETADGVLSIPCTGPVESLNAAVAGSILLYLASQQRMGEASQQHIGAAR